MFSGGHHAPKAGPIPMVVAPPWWLAVATVLAFLVTGILAYTTSTSYHTLRALRDRDIALIDVLGSIVHLDEVLTMSARMAAVTGDERWVERYRFYEPELARVIDDAQMLAPDSEDTAFLRQTDSANRRLVMLETRALELARQGRLDEARGEVFGEEYERLKSDYIGGAIESRRACELRIRKNLVAQSNAVLTNGVLATIAALGGFTLLVVWVRWLGFRERRRHELQVATRRSTLGQLAAGLAHELNQPLGTLVNYCGAARAMLFVPEIDRERVSESIELAESQARRAGAIIARVRAFVQGDEIEHTPVTLDEVAREGVRLVMAEARRAGVPIRVQARSGAQVMGDAIQLQQVVVNLLVNAIDALGDGVGGAISVEALADDHFAIVRVTDEGAGIPKEQEKHLFEAFHSTKPDGLGLGLNLCRAIAESHRGEISYQRVEGRTVFTLRLPRAKIET